MCLAVVCVEDGLSQIQSQMLTFNIETFTNFQFLMFECLTLVSVFLLPIFLYRWIKHEAI